jgi:adenylate cyclase
MDIIFEAPGNVEHDERLAEAIGDSGNVVLLERVRDDEPVEGLVREWRIQPIEAFRNAAAATAPFTLPRIPIRVAQFWTFGRGSSDTANLPLVALQLYALPVYDEFRALLGSTTTIGTSQVPPSASALRSFSGLETGIREIRRIFLADAALRSRMLTAIRTEASTSEHAAMLRALIDAYADGNSRYLNFYGPAGTVRTIPYHEILGAERGAIEDFDLSGKMVFVGYSERRQAEQQDEFISVYSERSGLNLSGVEIAATAFANLADRTLIVPLPIWAGLMLIFCGAAVLAGLFASITSRQATVVALLAGAAYFIAARYYFDTHYVWLPLVAPLGIVLPALWMIALLFNYRELARQRERIQAALGHYVPPSIARRLAEESFETGASRELVHGTCLVSDAEQFTQLAESMDPASLHTLVQQYFAVLTSVVERHGGFVADVSGDSMVAIWAGAKPDPALRRSACIATFEALECVDRFNADQRHRSLPTGIGLDTGELLLGNIGTAQRYHYRAVGDIVNTASRIQGLNRQLGTRALVSAATLDGLTNVRTRPLGEFLLLGKASPVAVHELIEADARVAEIADEFSNVLRFFREREWDRARTALERILAHSPDDGPSRFYLRQCDALRNTALPESWSGTIRISVK